MKLALCLAGGGVKGAAHIGVLKALEEKNIKYDYLSGTSSGSIVASLNAMGYNSDEIYKLFKRYCRQIKGVEIKNIWKLIWGLLLERKIIIDGLNSGDSIERIVSKAAREKGIYNINQIQKNLQIPSVDLESGELYIFSSMEKRKSYEDDVTYISDISIGKAVRASCSYPGAFSPCRYKDRQLIDGGIRENLPWKETKASGADKVLCVKFQEENKGKVNRNIIDILSDSIGILCHELSNYEIDGADYVINIKTQKVSLLDYRKIDYLYEQGYKEGKKFIDNNLIS